MRAVGGEDGDTHVSADLCSAQHTCLAAACLALQRGRAAIPSLEPAAQDIASALHCMATGEGVEAASGIVWSILEEDVMLGFGAEMLHGRVESEPSQGSATVRQARWDGAKIGLTDACLPHERTNSSRVKPTRCMRRARDDDHMLSWAGCARCCFGRRTRWWVATFSPSATVCWSCGSKDCKKITREHASERAPAMIEWMRRRRDHGKGPIHYSTLTA